MTINKRKLRIMLESMRMSITKEQESTILNRFGTESDSYVWTEQDNSFQIQNFIGCGEFVKTVQNNCGWATISYCTDF